MNITRLHPGLSDLFFNHTHDNYDAACAANRALKPDRRDLDSERHGLLQDARDFCAELAAAYNANEDPEALMDDFFQRI